MFTTGKPFFRTPKRADASALRNALLSAREEILLLTAMLTAAITISSMPNTSTLDMHLWVVVLLVQAMPYVAALIVAIISGAPNFLAAGRGFKAFW